MGGIRGHRASLVTEQFGRLEASDQAGCGHGRHQGRHDHEQDEEEDVARGNSSRGVSTKSGRNTRTSRKAIPTPTTMPTRHAVTVTVPVSATMRARISLDCSPWARIVTYSRRRWSSRPKT